MGPSRRGGCVDARTNDHHRMGVFLRDRWRVLSRLFAGSKMKLMVNTAAYWPTDEIYRQKTWLYRRSCEKFGIAPRCYVWHRP